MKSMGYFPFPSQRAMNPIRAVAPGTQGSISQAHRLHLGLFCLSFVAFLYGIVLNKCITQNWDQPAIRHITQSMRQIVMLLMVASIKQMCEFLKTKVTVICKRACNNYHSYPLGPVGGSPFKLTCCLLTDFYPAAAQMCICFVQKLLFIPSMSLLHAAQSFFHPSSSSPQQGMSSPPCFQSSHHFKAGPLSMN